MFPLKGRLRTLMAFVVLMLGSLMMGVIPFTQYLAVLVMAFVCFGFVYGYIDTGTNL